MPALYWEGGADLLNVAGSPESVLSRGVAYAVYTERPPLEECTGAGKGWKWFPRQGAVAVVRERGGWDGVEEHGREFQKSFGSGSNNTGNRPSMET